MKTGGKQPARGSGIRKGPKPLNQDSRDGDPNAESHIFKRLSSKSRKRFNLETSRWQDTGSDWGFVKWYQTLTSSTPSLGGELFELSKWTPCLACTRLCPWQQKHRLDEPPTLVGLTFSWKSNRRHRRKRIKEKQTKKKPRKFLTVVNAH